MDSFGAFSFLHKNLTDLIPQAFCIGHVDFFLRGQAETVDLLLGADAAIYDRQFAFNLISCDVSHVVLVRL
jgi:hypothetical protein